MSAREQILARVRGAVRDAPPAPEVPRDYRRTSTLAPSAVLDRFEERLLDYRASVVRCAAADVEAELARLLDACDRVVVPDGFGWAVPGSEPDHGHSAPELDAVDAVVTTATVGIAETGTLVLTHGPGQGRRALSLVPDLHVCVISTDLVVPNVTDAVPLLAEPGPQTWISGPSATSDIELTRVEGVHGPRTLCVVLAGPDGR